VIFPSDSRPSGQRFQVDIWSWSTWLVLVVVSYPAVLVILTAPRAGLLGALGAAAVLLMAAGLGYAGRREPAPWLWSSASSLALGALVAAVALSVDRTTQGAAVLCGLAVAGEMTFIWHFLPWIAGDADPPAARREAGLQLLRTSSPAVGVRAALALALLLAFLVLGLGAAWARGSQTVPVPTGWLIALAVLSFGLMFVERMSFFERSAREGNLVMPAGSHRRWIAAGLLFLLASAAIAAAVPLRPSPESPEAGDASSAAAHPSPPALPREEPLSSASRQAAAGVQRVAAAALALPRAMLALWLLLFLLLAALILVWGFRRGRAARWLLWVLGAVLALAARAWRGFVTAVRRLMGPRKATVAVPEGRAAGTPEDPLSNPFEDPDVLADLSPRELVIRTYHLLLDFAEMLGSGRRRGQTPFEYAHALQASAPDAREPLMALTWAYAGAMYGGGHFELPDPGEVRRFWERISQALTEGVSPEDLALRRRAYLAARTLEREQ